MPRHATKLKLTAAVVSGIFVLGAGLAGCQREQSTASLLAEARQYQQKGDRKAALIQLKNAVAKSPEDGEARLALGTLYLEIGDPVSAEKELRKAQSLGIAATRSLPSLARALQAQGQPQKVLDELKPELVKDAPELLALRGHALLGLGKRDEARQAYQDALAARPDAAEPRLGLARLAMLDQDREGAHRLIDEAAAKEPRKVEIFMAKGALLRAEGKPDEALAAYEQVLAVEPGHRDAHIEKAYLEIAKGKFEAARADIDAARKASPGNLLVAYSQALLDFSQGKFAAAQESLQKVLRAAPEHPPTLLLSGAVELNLGQTQQAEQHLRKYLEAAPANVYARKLLAQTLLKSAQPDGAVAALAPALKDAPQDAQLLALAGESYMQARDFDKATSYFEKASALEPKAAALHTSLGLSRLGKGEHDKGLSELELATTLDPKSAAAGMALVQTELGLKRFDKALAAAQALEKQQPDNAQVQNLKGAVYLAKEDRAGARAAFEKALALQPAFFAAAANLARLDLQDKHPDAAKKRFETLLEKDKKNAAAMAALADLALVQGKADVATTWLEKASNENPDAVAPALRLGNQYLATRQPRKALTLARKFQTQNPTNADLLDLLGQAQLASEDAEGALETYSKLVNVLPKSGQAQLRLAAVHRTLKNDDAAAADLRRAIELQPELVPARVAQAQLALARGKPDDAIATARALQKQSGANATAGYLLEGDVQLAQKQPAAALPLFQKAYAASKSPQVAIKLAEAYKLAGKAPDADALLAQWQKEHPDDQAVPLYLAERLLADGQYKPAIGALEALVKRNPNNAIALNNLAWAYQQDKNPRALETAERAYGLAAGNPAVLDTLGWMLVEQGKLARALPLLQQAASLTGEPAIRYHLAVALEKSGDKENARKTLQELLAKGARFPDAQAARALLQQLG